MGANEKLYAALYPATPRTRIVEDGTLVALIDYDGVWHTPSCYVADCQGECSKVRSLSE